MAEKGEEPTGMGNDAPLAVPSIASAASSGYFGQQFAQVTNPPTIPSAKSFVYHQLRRRRRKLFARRDAGAVGALELPHP
jgi:hypothetical protein